MNKAYSHRSGTVKSYLWQFILITLAFSVLGITTLSIMGFSVSLRWLPLIPVALWPRTAPAITSVIVLFFMGLFQDWIGYDVPGQWALIYLLCYVVLKPYERLRPLQFGQAYFNWAVAVFIAFTILTVSGRLIYGVWPDWNSLLRSIMWTSVLLPVFWMLRKFVQDWILGQDS